MLDVQPAHLHTQYMTSAVAEVEGRVLIVKPTYREGWGIPGGGVDGKVSVSDFTIKKTTGKASPILF